MNGMKMPMDDRDWEAEGDANHLMMAAEIKGDSQRHASAKAAASKLADEKFAEAKNLKRAARGISGGKTEGLVLPKDLVDDGWKISG
jgi:hypothetical protein